MRQRKRTSYKLHFAPLDRLEDRTLLSTFGMQHPRHPALPEVRSGSLAPVVVPVASSVVNGAGRAHTFLYKVRPAAGGPAPATSPPSTALTPAELRNIYSLN